MAKTYVVDLINSVADAIERNDTGVGYTDESTGGLAHYIYRPSTILASYRNRFVGQLSTAMLTLMGLATFTVFWPECCCVMG